MSWQEVTASDGSIYYYNSATQQSVREKPEELFTELDRYLYKTDWRQHTTGNGKTYYYNINTSASVWELPAEVQQLIDAEKKSEARAPSEAAVQETVQKDDEIENKDQEVKEYEEEDEEGEAEENDDSDGKRENETPVDLGNPNERYHNDSKILRVEKQTRLAREGDDAFTEMLREEGVDSTWSFSKVLEFFITDTRYWLVEDALQKKQLFESYLNNRTHEELKKENNSVEKFKTAFITLLQSRPEIKYYTRWKTARGLLQDEPIYAHSVISEKIKKETFQEHVDKLRSAHTEKESSLHTLALSELREYFKTMNLNLTSTWEKTLGAIKSDKRFEQNKHFTALTQLDLITLYEETIRELQQEYQERIHDQSRVNYRNDRIARDGFRELLAELKEGGLLKADTTWEEVYPLIEEDDRFLAMLGRNGSTPLELFKDVIEEEELLIRAKKGIVDQVLIKHGYIVDDEKEEAVQKSEIMELLKDDEQTKEFDEDTIDLIYVKLVKDAKKQKEKDRFAKERKLRRAQDSFKSMLRDLREPAVTENSKWEEFKDLIKEKEEYLALPDDDTRRVTFDKFVSRIAEAKKEAEQRKEEELKRIIANASNARREINQKKRPLSPKDATDELDY